jgi:hypothetical protein
MLGKEQQQLETDQGRAEGPQRRRAVGQKGHRAAAWPPLDRSSSRGRSSWGRGGALATYGICLPVYRLGSGEVSRLLVGEVNRGIEETGLGGVDREVNQARPRDDSAEMLRAAGEFTLSLAA